MSVSVGYANDHWSDAMPERSTLTMQVVDQHIGSMLRFTGRFGVGPDPYTSEDRKEGIRAFLERRPPVWKGR